MAYKFLHVANRDGDFLAYFIDYEREEGPIVFNLISLQARIKNLGRAGWHNTPEEDKAEEALLKAMEESK